MKKVEISNLLTTLPRGYVAVFHQLTPSGEEVGEPITIQHMNHHFYAQAGGLDSFSSAEVLSDWIQVIAAEKGASPVFAGLVTEDEA